MKKTFLYLGKKVLFRESSELVARAKDVEIQITNFETGLRLLKHFGHLLEVVEIDTDSYTQAQVSELAQHLHTYCANTLIMLSVSGDKVGSVVGSETHFPKVEFFHINFEGIEKFHVAYAFSRLVEFEVKVIHRALLPVEVLEQNSGLKSVLALTTAPKDLHAYLKHAKNPNNIERIAFRFELPNPQIEDEVSGLVSEFGSVNAIGTHVFVNEGQDIEAKALTRAAKAAWNGRVYTNFGEFVNDKVRELWVVRE